jgi:hypothetical protein
MVRLCRLRLLHNVARLFFPAQTSSSHRLGDVQGGCSCARLGPLFSATMRTATGSGRFFSIVLMTPARDCPAPTYAASGWGADQRSWPVHQGFSAGELNLSRNGFHWQSSTRKDAASLPAGNASGPHDFLATAFRRGLGRASASKRGSWGRRIHRPDRSSTAPPCRRNPNSAERPPRTAA